MTHNKNTKTKNLTLFNPKIYRSCFLSGFLLTTLFSPLAIAGWTDHFTQCTGSGAAGDTLCSQCSQQNTEIVKKIKVTPCEHSGSSSSRSYIPCTPTQHYTLHCTFKNDGKASGYVGIKGNDGSIVSKTACIYYASCDHDYSSNQAHFLVLLDPNSSLPGSAFDVIEQDHKYNVKINSNPSMTVWLGSGSGGSGVANFSNLPTSKVDDVTKWCSAEGASCW
jgi:hypothetical protein